jgi:hypothetical protein
MAGAAGTHMAWHDRMPGDDLAASNELRRLLTSDGDACSRHYMFSELEHRVYRCRTDDSNCAG